MQLGRQAIGLAQNVGVGVEQIDRSRKDWFGRSLDRGSAGMAGQRQIAQLHREPGGGEGPRRAERPLPQPESTAEVAPQIHHQGRH